MNKESDDAVMRTGVATTAGAATWGGLSRASNAIGDVHYYPPGGDTGRLPVKRESSRRDLGYASAHCGDGEPRPSTSPCGCSIA